MELREAPVLGKRLPLIVCLCCASCAWPTGQTPQAPPATQQSPAAEASVPEVTPATLFEAYFTDPDRAEKEYDGKPLKIEGTIQGHETYHGKPCLNLYVPKFDNAPRIRCVFAAKDTAEVEAKVSGRKVRIQGRCIGGQESDVTKQTHLTLEKCIIIGYDPK
jgi:hypothetical protein